MAIHLCEQKQKRSAYRIIHEPEYCELTAKSGKIKPSFIKIIVIKSYYSFINRFGSFPWKINVKQVQDCSVEMTLNKPPSWVKQLFKSLPGYQA